MDSPHLPNVSDHLRSRAQAIGFSLLGITPAVRPETLEYFRDWIHAGLHGTMEYLPRRERAYEHPAGVQMGVKTILMAALNYGPGENDGPRENDVPGEDVGDRVGRIAAYAQGTADYHDVMRHKLSELADALHQQMPQARTRIAVDTAPLLERDAAQRAGLGWFGKNTMLINKWTGSYFFLGAILTDVELPYDAPHQTDHCGTCTRCLDACPTQAFQGPHVLDASRCISYLTIELREQPVPLDLRTGMGNWLFGCDLCQQVCPWNRKSSPTAIPELRPRPDQLPQAEAILNMSPDEFRDQYKQTPFARPGHSGMARNAAIVLGNSHDERSVPTLAKALDDHSPPFVRGAVAWALGEIATASAQAVLQRRLLEEPDAQVQAEIAAALQRISPGSTSQSPLRDGDLPGE